jgi:hypothetical protein
MRPWVLSLAPQKRKKKEKETLFVYNYVIN